MLVAIISDIHDNLANLDKCLAWCRTQRIDKMIFCGDTTTLETAGRLTAGFPGPIFMVRGNIEIYEEDELKAFPALDYRGDIGREEIGGLLLGFCHEPEKIKAVLAMAPEKPDFIFYGHTHKPWLEKRDRTSIVNPGNLAGTFHQATFAVLDTETKKLDLKILSEIKD